MALSGVVFNRFPEIAAKFPVQCHDAVVQMTGIVEDLAKVNAHVRSGFLRDSIYHVTSEGSDYGNASPPTDDVYLLPPGPGVADRYTGYVGVAANYGGFVELGTRFMAPEPYFYPAVDEGRVRWEAVLAAMLSFL